MTASGELDRRILDLLKQSVARTQQQIATALGVSRETCRIHLKRLENQGLILGKAYRIAAEDDKRTTGYVLIKTAANPKRRHAVERTLKESLAVVSFNMITGHDYDYIATVNVSIRSDEMRKFIEDLRDINGTETETLVIIG
jgi:DNA-binding Lrp family transcriptional regulator